MKLFISCKQLTKLESSPRDKLQVANGVHSEGRYFSWYLCLRREL